jgi:toxin ParE1/3/4
MTDPYRLTTEALQDLNDIWDYVGQDNPRAADALIEQLLRTCQLLAQSPRLGRRREDLAQDLRSHPVGRYLIFYRVHADVIQIVRFLYGGRDLHAVFAAMGE